LSVHFWLLDYFNLIEFPAKKVKSNQSATYLIIFRFFWFHQKYKPNHEWSQERILVAFRVVVSSNLRSSIPNYPFVNHIDANHSNNHFYHTFSIPQTLTFYPMINLTIRKYIIRTGRVRIYRFRSVDRLWNTENLAIKVIYIEILWGYVQFLLTSE
jgi:hypothetical protein